MKRFNAEPGDTVTMTANDVTHVRTGPITSGLSGMMTLYDAADTIVDTFPMSGNVDDDWYVEIDAPATAGLYRMSLVMVVGSAQRTLEAELRVT